MTATEQVILVDQNDRQVGVAEKIYAHRANLCHRAFSVFILRRAPELQVLLQQRADSKYHSKSLWTNTCCSHPRPGEEILAAGQRRLYEEMGIRTSLLSLGWFHYIAPLDDGLSENEIDYVLIGNLQEPLFTPNPLEVKAYRWVNLPDLHEELRTHTAAFTAWFAKALKIVEKNFANS